MHTHQRQSLSCFILRFINNKIASRLIAWRRCVFSRTSVRVVYSFIFQYGVYHLWAFSDKLERFGVPLERPGAGADGDAMWPDLADNACVANHLQGVRQLDTYERIITFGEVIHKIKLSNFQDDMHERLCQAGSPLPDRPSTCRCASVASWPCCDRDPSPRNRRLRWPRLTCQRGPAAPGSATSCQI